MTLSEASCGLSATVELLVAKHLSYIGHAHELLSVIDNVIKIICCSEPTDSFMVNVTVAKLPGHSRGTRFYSRGTCPGWPPLGAATVPYALWQWSNSAASVTVSVVIDSPLSVQVRFVAPVSMLLHSFSKFVRVLTNLAKWNSPSFPAFPDPLNSFFQTTIKWKPDVTNHLSSQFGSFLVELQNILLKEHGDWLHPRQSLCHPTNLRCCYWHMMHKLTCCLVVCFRLRHKKTASDKIPE